MQRCLRLLLCAFVCLCALFSNSAYVLATDKSDGLQAVNDGSYNPISTMEVVANESVFTYHWKNSAWVNSNNSNVTLEGTGHTWFMHEIYLAEPIDKNAIFDIVVDLKHGPIEEFNITRVSLFDNSFATLEEKSNPTIEYRRNSDENKRFSITDLSTSNGSVSCIQIEYIVNPSNSITSLNFPFIYYGIKVETVSNDGLLSGIIGWVKNTYNAIIDLPSEFANSISGFFSNVVNAVINLGTSLLDGIKNLFIPTSEDITELKEDWENLLEQRFGGLYQSIEIIDSYADSFNASETKTITFPKVSIPLGEYSFDFGGWNVQIVPNGFDFLIDALKLIISIVCTFAFVNSLKNRFERLIGGSTNI